jgi:predicted Zn-dependent protease
LYLRGLTALRPHDQRYRFQLAVHQLENDETARAVSNLMELTTGNGYMPARMWLVEQAISSKPLLPLEDDRIEDQLRMILAKEPTNLRANQIIADLHLRNGQFKAAEDRLAKIVDELPALGLPLAKVERLLKRNEEQVDRHLGQAEAVFRDRLIQNPAVFRC